LLDVGIDQAITAIRKRNGAVYRRLRFGEP
jgi:hypothetical protein